MSKPGTVLLVAFVVLLGMLGTFYLGVPGPQAAKPPAVMAPPSGPDADASPVLGETAETHRLAMQVAYADLEKDRLLLNRQLGALNAKLWGLRLPAARARTIQGDMMAAKSLLTNPPLLGAFQEVGGIQRERERVSSARVRLESIENELRAVPPG